MKKIFGILGLLVAIVMFTSWQNPDFLTPYNIQNNLRWIGLFGILGIGVAFVIITGGIDLSVGSVVGLVGCVTAMLLSVSHPPSNVTYNVVDVVMSDGDRPIVKAIVVQGDATRLTRLDKVTLEPTEPDDRTGITVEAVSFDGQNTRLEFGGRVKRDDVQDKVYPRFKTHMNIGLAVVIVLVMSLGIGLIHGLLITKLRLQPFVVTLCGLLIYRGVARWLAGDATQGFGQYFEGLKYLAKGKPFSAPVPFIAWYTEGRTTLNEAGAEVATPLFQWVPVPMPFLILAGIAVIAAIFLNWTIYGRYLLALGRNVEAARYSGINTDRMVVIAYVLSSMGAGIAGILFALDLNSIQPSGHGNFYELYAIAAAVLGGCSLRGGEGAIVGVVLGTAIIRVLSNAINVLGIPTQLEFAVIGAVILVGVIVDELVKRLAAKRRAIREASGAT